jgi:hypothetical protein
MACVGLGGAAGPALLEHTLSALAGLAPKLQTLAHVVVPSPRVSHSVRARPGRFSALSVSRGESILYVSVQAA